MVSAEIKKRVEYLRAELAYHSKKYYENDAPEISDYEYDMMFAELKRLEEENPSLYDATSPTQRVGGKALDKFEKVAHAYRMKLHKAGELIETVRGVGYKISDKVKE